MVELISLDRSILAATDHSTMGPLQPNFECGAFNHSATSPNKAQRLKRRAAYLTARAERHKKGNQNRRNMERPEARCD
jgi:hypothetical protein